ncbi:putative Disease resistance protein family [Hibiscus syriacus]|uniref:Disease resistance protein family n=1 Tax=Hibiscus syriacus TaxID=106335 RepID=A0A6A3C1V9_HIBSY|nr:probable disease resistance protein At1g12290 [Hibiscus syriacus]KAE8721192.1 putative Disease resistance protein family [Hibiscus syriacus]
MGNCFSVQCSFENILIRGWDCIVGRANYVCKLKETLPALAAALAELRVQKNDVQREVDLAEQRQLKRLDQVQLWLSKAETMITEAENLIADGPQQINNLCLGGCLSKNCLSTYKFGKKVAKMLQDIRDHMSKGVFDRVAETRPAASVVVRPEDRTVALESTIDKVWSCIMDNDVGIIGLYGIGGVGKTTLLTQINNKFSTTLQGFDIVIWSLVSKDYNVEKIQDRIGGRIGFSDESWKNRSVDQKAEDIYGVLRHKRFVVLLDDLWERVDLNKVGIPKPSKENGSKLIFTTRSLEVCGEMEAQKNLELECLKSEEAWKLFQDKVGDETLNSHPDIPKLAEHVAKECDGLPLALITIGRAMARKRTPGEWRYAIEKLKRSTLPKMEKEVYPLLKFSYDNLSSTMKCCLLYCCLYPEDYNIPTKTLVEYWFCEGLLNEFDRFSEAQMQGDNIINSLLSACLLERAEESIYGENQVKMHDVIRDMGLWIACEPKEEEKEKSFFVKAGAQLLEEPDVKAWEGAKRMSVMKNQIKVLRGTPKCPSLRTLFLSQNKLQVINDGFFQFMPHLTVLDLSWNRDLKALPKGISQLISLECLDLSGTRITELQMELKSLTKLKMLDMSEMLRLRRIPQNLISSFSKLQIFRLGIDVAVRGGFPKEDNVLDGNDNEKVIVELKSLQHLNILRIPEIQSMSAIQSFLSHHLFRCSTEALEFTFQETNVFNVLCLEHMERLEMLDIRGCGNMEEMKMEKLHTRGSPSTNYTSGFHTLREVRIFSCNKLKDVTWLFLTPNLRYLGIWNCSEMEEILSEGKHGEVADVVGIPYPTPFLNLLYLRLWDLPELKSIYWDALPFPCLKHIKIGNCPKLKKLPLNSDSAKGNHITIQGPQDWWEQLEWENEATRNAFMPSFQGPFDGRKQL